MEKSSKTKKFVQNLIKKRLVKKGAGSEFYKSELPEHISSAVNGAKETAALSLILFIIFDKSGLEFSSIRFLIFIFLAVFILYKICQVTLLAWLKLHKLNRIIEDEKYEIEHHRKREREELEMIYSAKGFSGPLLNDVIDTLMADDNRLLQVMIEEEMGLTLGQFEHPLKQGMFAALGVLFTSLFAASALIIGARFEFFLLIAIAMIGASSITIREEKSNLSFLIFWNIAALAFLGFATFFLTKFIQSLR